MAICLEREKWLAYFLSCLPYVDVLLSRSDSAPCFASFNSLEKVGDCGDDGSPCVRSVWTWIDVFVRWRICCKITISCQPIFLALATP